MSKRNVSRCTFPKKANTDYIYVNIKNGNEHHRRQFDLAAYDRTLPTKQSLPIYANSQPIQKDNLEPGEEKTYKVDVSTVQKKVVLEIIQTGGGSGIKVSRNSKNQTASITIN